MVHKVFRLDSFIEAVEKHRGSALLQVPILEEVVAYATRLKASLDRDGATWHCFDCFWPPRYVRALVDGEAIVFFGSGLSLPCGVPTWSKLLTDNLGLDKSIADDEDVQSDPLTMAELAAEYLGTEKLQDVLRGIMNRPQTFSVNHAALCALRCPVYITTNYDTLFEKAWKQINPTLPFATITNDADLARVPGDTAMLLFKIHGSSDRGDEHMILTRRDYRFHYRANLAMFDRVRDLLARRHTLFLGFGHRDPEVSRLVDDAIHAYERDAARDDPAQARPRPQFYSLQFDMKQHTSEVYAARGIVALRPPAVATAFEDIRSKALAVSLIDLVAARQCNLHERESLDGYLDTAVQRISKPLNDGLATLAAWQRQARELLEQDANGATLDKLAESLGPLASQGVYLLDDQGTVHMSGFSSRLFRADRLFGRKPLNDRPYFQQAKLFRAPFVSNSARSVLNGQSTLFLCAPVIDAEQMVGLLFAATQVGQWTAPIEVARSMWEKDLDLLMIDGNGTCLLPPANEFPLQPPPVARPTEPDEANLGYPYERLYTLSRRDRLVRHIGRNVVPVSQDDDVLDLSEDVTQYTVVTQLPRTSIKVGVSVAVHFGRARR